MSDVLLVNLVGHPVCHGQRSDLDSLHSSSNSASVDFIAVNGALQDLFLLAYCAGVTAWLRWFPHGVQEPFQSNTDWRHLK